MKILLPTPCLVVIYDQTRTFGCEIRDGIGIVQNKVRWFIPGVLEVQSEIYAGKIPDERAVPQLVGLNRGYRSAPR